MGNDEHQAFLELLTAEYRTMFASMDDASRATWFFSMDESVILGFDVGKDENLMQAEARHATKLQAIATALGSLPCAEKEARTIEDLRAMASAIQQRHETQRLTASHQTTEDRHESR
jgi:hypothetical protein